MKFCKRTVKKRKRKKLQRNFENSQFLKHRKG